VDSDSNSESCPRLKLVVDSVCRISTAGSEVVQRHGQDQGPTV
jgi:hypothetical protein